MDRKEEGWQPKVIRNDVEEGRERSLLRDKDESSGVFRESKRGKGYCVSELGTRRVDEWVGREMKGDVEWSRVQSRFLSEEG